MGRSAPAITVLVLGMAAAIFCARVLGFATDAVLDVVLVFDVLDVVLVDNGVDMVTDANGD